MNLKFITQVDITDQQIGICHDYFCPSTGVRLGLLDHIAGLCHQQGIGVDELATAVGKVKVYDTTVCCSKCNVFLQLDMPQVSSREKDFLYICDACHGFIHCSS